MANPVGDPEAVAALARRYRAEADQAETLQAEAARHLEDTTWVGRRATRARERMAHRQGEVARQADSLRNLAATLDRHADWMRATIREMAALESRIRSWAAAHPPDPNRPGPDATLIGYWPPSFDLDWRQLAQRLRSQGASF